MNPNKNKPHTKSIVSSPWDPIIGQGFAISKSLTIFYVFRIYFYIL